MKGFFVFFCIFCFISNLCQCFAVKLDVHGPGLQALPTHDPVVQDAANHAVKTIQQRSNSLVPYELKEIVHAKAEVSSIKLLLFSHIFSMFKCFVIIVK